jgi:hypothetical protein
MRSGCASKFDANYMKTFSCDIELGLRSYSIESFNQLLHDLLAVLFILFAKHADQVHDQLDKVRIFKIEVDNKAFEDVLVFIKECFRVSFEHLCVPLYDSFICLT